MIKLQPKDLGLNSKFASWRPHQIQAVDEAVHCRTRFSLHQQPTGSGKSVTYLAAYRFICLRAQKNHTKEETPRMLVLTATKPLQDQLSRDFGNLGLADIRGKANYPCKALNFGGELQHLAPFRHSRHNADGAPCEAQVTCSLKSYGCDYFDALRYARSQAIVVSNYAMWMSQQNPKNLGNFDFLILDEAHDTPSILTDHLTQTLHESEVTEFCDWPRHQDTEALGQWASNLIPIVEQETHQDEDAELEEVRVSVLATRLLRKLNIIQHASSDWFVVWDATNTGNRLRIQPHNPAYFAEDYLFRGINRVMLFSANVTPKVGDKLGIDRTDSTFYETIHSFPVNHRRIFHIPTARIRHGMSSDETRRVFTRADQVIRRWPNAKGLIHTVSYSRARTFERCSQFKDRIILDSPGETYRNLKFFRETTDPVIFVSPAIMTGYDFPDDIARWQIVMKVPFLDTSDPLTALRCKGDSSHTCETAIQRVVQAAGRIVRGPEDWGITYILDDQIKWLIWKYKDWTPRWFGEAFMSVSTIPDPHLE